MRWTNVVDERHPIGMTIAGSESAIIRPSSRRRMPIQEPSTLTLHDPQRAHHLLMLEFGSRTQTSSPEQAEQEVPSLTTTA